MGEIVGSYYINYNITYNFVQLNDIPKRENRTLANKLVNLKPKLSISFSSSIKLIAILLHHMVSE